MHRRQIFEGGQHIADSFDAVIFVLLAIAEHVDADAVAF